MHFTCAFLFMHWRHCKLLASMWVYRASFILKLSMWVCAPASLCGVHLRMLMFPTLVSIRECSEWTPGHSWTQCCWSWHWLFWWSWNWLFVEADINCFASTPLPFALPVGSLAAPMVGVLRSWTSASGAQGPIFAPPAGLEDKLSSLITNTLT